MNRDDAAYSVAPKKSLGQHFLTSDIVPRWMCDAAAVTPADTVLEIGPGTGILTAELLQRGVMVHAIETDARSLAILQERFATAIAQGTLVLHQHDVRHGLPETITAMKHYKVVANIPYYLSGLLLRTFLETSHQPTTIVFLLQKELAERIARDTKRSLFQLSVQAFGTPTYIRSVSAGHFHPPPKVTSAILAITDITHDRVPPERTAHFFAVLHAGFAHKRKFALSNLAKQWDKELVRAAFATCQLSPQIRPEAIDLADWVKLAHELPVQSV